MHLSEAHAEGIGLKIQPANLQISATAPADTRSPFSLTNNSEASVNVSVLVKRIRPAATSDGQVDFVNPLFVDEREADQFLKNVQVLDGQFAVNSLTLAPRQQKKLELSLAVGENSPPVDHYIAVVFLTTLRSQTNTSEADTTSALQAGVSLPVVLSIGANKESTKLFVDEFSSPVFIQSGPVPFLVKLKNSGTHFIVPKGVILIKNSFGQTVGRVDLPKTTIFSGSSRYISNNSHSESKNNSPRISWPEKFLLGFYTAELSIATQQDEVLYTQSINFFAFPFVAIIFIIALIVLIFSFIKRVRKKLAQE